MNFDVTTFAFEVVNFLVLIWLLHRFFYRPILAVIDRRRSDIERRLEEAKKARQEGAALEAKYLGQLNDLERERGAARLQQQEALQAERTKQFAQLQSQLDQERERNRSLDLQRDRERAVQAEKASVHIAAEFVKRLLERFTGPELDARLVASALEELNVVSQENRLAMGQALQDHDGAAKVETAYLMGTAARTAVVQALAAIGHRPIRCEFVETPELIAGLRVTAGHWVLSANLLEELKFFEDTARDSGTRGNSV